MKSVPQSQHKSCLVNPNWCLRWETLCFRLGRLCYWSVIEFRGFLKKHFTVWDISYIIENVLYFCLAVLGFFTYFELLG